MSMNELLVKLNLIKNILEMASLESKDRSNNEYSLENLNNALSYAINYIKRNEKKKKREKEMKVNEQCRKTVTKKR